MIEMDFSFTQLHMYQLEVPMIIGAFYYVEFT
ncbi:hypothetical protein SAMN04488168_106146 [Bacillus sp. 491mf]|nr:hypothetical protein SAMN04488168_106146 [Bacillus sp. 491mf]